MGLDKETRELFESLNDMAPAGVIAGLHVRAAQARVFYSSLNPEWLEYYRAQSYFLRDPCVFWAISRTGVTRWSEITLPDPFDLLGEARRFGLAYGATASAGAIEGRSIISICSDLREFTDAELTEFERITHQLHAHHEERLSLTPAQAEALRLLAAGDRHTAAAARLGISESAFKARLKLARAKLKARTTSEAIRKAREHQLI